MTRFRSVGTKRCFVGWIDIWRSWSGIRLSSLGSWKVIRFSRSCNLAHIVSAHLSLCFIVFPFGRERFIWSLGIWEHGALKHGVNFEHFFARSEWKKMERYSSVKDKLKIIILFLYILMYNYRALTYYALIRCKIINWFHYFIIIYIVKNYIYWYI